MKIQSLTNTRLVLALLAAGVVGGAGVTVVSAQRADGTSAPFVASAHAAPAAAPVAPLATMNGAPDFSAITQRYGAAVVNISVVGTAGADSENPLAQGGVDPRVVLAAAVLLRYHQALQCQHVRTVGAAPAHGAMRNQQLTIRRCGLRRVSDWGSVQVRRHRPVA